MSAGDKFHIDLGGQGDAVPDDPSEAWSATPFVGDIVERGVTRTSSAAPSAPQLRTTTGFPSHTKKVFASSKFKQKLRAEDGAAPESAPQPDTSHGQPKDPLLREKQQIDIENRERLAAMSPTEIEEARQELLGQLDPALLQSLLRRADIASGSNEASDTHNVQARETRVEESYIQPGKRVMFDDDDDDDNKNHNNDDSVIQGQSDIRVAEQNTLSHHDSIHFPQPEQPPDLDPNSETFLEDLHSKYFPSLPAEPDKLEWMRASKDTRNPYSPASSAFNPRDIRFDFKGALLPPSTAAQIPVSAGLHHHADAPDAAGYTIPELGHLSRSTYAPQRCIAFQTLGRILYKLGKGEFGDPGEPGANTVGAEDTMGELARGLWREIEVEHVIEQLVAESEGNGVDGGKHVSAKAYATEAVWLWRKGGGRRWKAD